MFEVRFKEAAGATGAPKIGERLGERFQFVRDVSKFALIYFAATVAIFSCSLH